MKRRVSFVAVHTDDLVSNIWGLIIDSSIMPICIG